jgi:spermidine synthase
MVLQVVILFGFQVLHGYVYAEVSLIVTAFMAGLALGGAASNRWLSRSAGSDPERQRANIKRLLLGDLIAIMVYNLVTPLILRSPIPAPELVFPMLGLMAGFLTSVAFPLSVAFTGGDAGRTAGMLYGADLLGGCLGAFLGAVFLVPVFGIAETCLIVAFVALAGALVLVK